MHWEKLMNWNEIFLIWPEIKDITVRGMYITSGMSPLILKVFRDEYLDLVKMIIHNFTYDDKSDWMFHHNHEIN